MLVPSPFVRSRAGRARPLRRSVRLFGATALGLACAAAACAETETVDPLVVRSAIAIRAASLTEGLGCGRGPTEVYRYAAVAFLQGSTTVLGAGLYECYADATFVELPPVNGTFDLEVHLYTEPAYTPVAALVDQALASGDALALRSSGATWTTRCTATEREKVLTFAACAPVTRGLGGVTGDAGTAAPDGGATDGGGAEAGDAAAGDAAADAP